MPNSKPTPVTINWGNKVYPLSSVGSEAFDVDSTKIGKDGIYQCTGFHHVYGRDVLLYIGYTGMGDEVCKAKKKTKDKAEGIKDEISRHLFFKNNARAIPNFFKPSSIRVRLGEIAYPKGVESVQLETIGGLLIFAHAPAWNYGEEIKYYWDEYKELRIKNTGECGGLLSTVNGATVCKKR